MVKKGFYLLKCESKVELDNKIFVVVYSDKKLKFITISGKNYNKILKIKDFYWK